MKTKIIDGLISILSLLIFIVSYFYKTDTQKLIICSISVILFFIFIYKFLKKDRDEEFKIVPSVGYRLDYGYYSASMINDGEDNAVKLQNSDILIFEGTPNNLEHEEMIKLLINEYREQGKPLTIILGGMSVRLATYLSVVFNKNAKNCFNKL